ncbi:MAG: hypothetical protein U9O54_03500, partial [Chloroflexota bacterium]|nr:hypothetical protein [Chloroflexota bacterium]
FGGLFSSVCFSTSTFEIALPPDGDLLINATPVGGAATPVGAAPDVEASPWPRDWQFSPRAIVYDLVYNPPETAFVRQARIAGLPAQTGLSMLVEQAALAFERWTGEMPPRG